MGALCLCAAQFVTAPSSARRARSSASPSTTRASYTMIMLVIAILRPRLLPWVPADINAHVWGSAQVTLDPATGQPIHATGDAAGFNGQGGGAGGAGSMPQGGVYAAGGDGGARSPNGGVVGAGGGGIGAGAGAGAAPVTVVSSDFINRLRSGNVGLDDFELLRVLGKGSFGKVFLVRLIATGEVYAMKVLKKSEVVRRRQVEHTKAERRIMGGIDHPFVVALRFAFQTADKLYMVTDYCKGGELFFHLKKFRTFPEPMVRGSSRRELAAVMVVVCC